jgi:NitT/TauT family transport system ATP-binding protein
MPIIEVKNLYKTYRSKKRTTAALQNVNLTIGANQFITLVGPSGCGKSTLLKAIGGFIRPVAGSIVVNGREVHGPGSDRMMVFQEFEQLMPWKTVLQNVMFPMRVSGKFKGEDARDRALAAIDKVSLTKFRDAYPHTLSGGMKMRVAIARAMAMEPDVLLMDEPFAALDALTRRRMQEELLALWDQLHFTVLFVTHSIEEAIVVGSRILILSPHPGRVRAELEAGALGYKDVDSAEFGALSKRIHSLLFGGEEIRTAAMTRHG